MSKYLLVFMLCMAVSVSSRGAETPQPTFTKKPTAKKLGTKVKIEFAVSRQTDVAVYIEDAKGKIVRHLVAGVLGKNVPEPLKPGLSQSLEWDGMADYGKAAGPGPFKVRVALGMGAKFDKVVARNPQNLDWISCLATGPDGTLYVLSTIGAAVPNWQTDSLVALDREGKYKRTVLPFPANISKSKLGQLPTINLEGRLSPLVHRIAGRSFYPGPSGSHGMTVTPKGEILRMNGGYWGAKGTFLTAMGTDGGIPWGKYKGPNLGYKLDRKQTMYLCTSSDGKWVYIAGIGKSPAVHRISIPERKKSTPFFGDPKTTGNDETHLGGAPAGICLDGKGNVLIADRSNNRVVVISEKNGKLVGSFPSKSPMALAVDSASGNIYLTRRLGSKSTELVKLTSWKDPKTLAVLKLKGGGSQIALDAGARIPIVWLSSGGLLRIQEIGGKFVSEKVNSKDLGRAAFVDISVDRFRPDKEIYARTNKGRWMRFNESTGKTSHVRIGKGSLGKGLCILPGPDGNLYGPEWPANLYKWNRNGQAVDWESPEKMPADFKRKNYYKSFSNGTFVPVCMTFMSHTMGIRHDNHCFVFSRLSSGSFRSPKALYEFLPSGKRMPEPIIWKVSDVAVGPRFDAQGNIYVAEIIKPKDHLFPSEFKDIVAGGKKGGAREDTPAGAVMTMYGSIIKFSPKGGMVKYPKIKYRQATNENPYKGQPKLAPGLKSEDVKFYYGHKFQALSPAKVIGAEWIRMGISHIDMFYCNCESTRFDVDEFGRVWYPDLGRFRVVCLDTNGNKITHFGGYGNADSAGPQSSIPKPEIAFAWLIGVAVTDNYAYMGDSLNRRMLRCKMVYAAEETCAIQ
jgi:NHL repeat